MNIGDRVTINKQMTGTMKVGHKTWAVVNIEPVEVVYLGTGQRWDGHLDHDYNNDGGYTQMWVNVTCHNCHQCHRRRRPASFADCRTIRRHCVRH